MIWRTQSLFKRINQKELLYLSILNCKNLYMDLTSVKIKMRNFYLSQNVRVQYFEDLIESKLANSLHRVTKECWGPSFSQSSDSFFCNCHFEAFDDSSVFCSIYLDTTLNHIKWYNSCVSKPTTQKTTKSTQCIELGRTKLTAVFL